MNKNRAALVAAITSVIVVMLIVLWVATGTLRAENQAVLLRAKAAYAPGHAAELAQYVFMLGNVGYIIPQIALLLGILLLGVAGVRMSFALSRRIENRIIHREEYRNDKIGNQFYIAPPETRVARHLSDRGIGVWSFDPRNLLFNRATVDSNDAAIPAVSAERKPALHASRKPARRVAPLKRSSGRSTGTTRRKR